MMRSTSGRSPLRFCLDMREGAHLQSRRRPFPAGHPSEFCLGREICVAVFFDYEGAEFFSDSTDCRSSGSYVESRVKKLRTIALCSSAFSNCAQCPVCAAE
jgi:hypothetical protein